MRLDVEDRDKPGHDGDRLDSPRMTITHAAYNGDESQTQTWLARERFL